MGEVSVLEGGSSGRSFSRSLPRSFSRGFWPCFAGTFRAIKTSAKTSALNSHDPAQQNWRNFREKLHDEVLQGDPRQELISEKLLISLRDGPCLELIIVSSNFQAVLLLQDKLLESV